MTEFTAPNLFLFGGIVHKLKGMLMEEYVKDERTKKGFKKKVWPSTPN